MNPINIFKTCTINRLNAGALNLSVAIILCLVPEHDSNYRRLQISERFALVGIWLPHLGVTWR